MRLLLARLFGAFFGRRASITLRHVGPVAYPCEGILCGAVAEWHGDAILDRGRGPVFLHCYYLCSRCAAEWEAFHAAGTARRALPGAEHKRRPPELRL